MGLIAGKAKEVIPMKLGLHSRSVIVAASVLVLVGCNKKGEEGAETAATPETAAQTPDTAPAAAQQAEAPAREILPGAAAVREALEKKDYSGAMGRFLTINASRAQEEKWMEYRVLYSELNTTLIEAAETDKKAAEALMTLRAVNSGR